MKALRGRNPISLRLCRRSVNLNGGNSKVTNAFPSVTGLYPQGIETESGWQIYAPIMNENVYTNDWTGPFYGFRKVIETFKLTDSPRRFKPITIYWHFYSGTKASALYALKDVYDWALKQPALPLYISEYAPRVEGFYQCVMATDLNGDWYIQNLGALRTLRVGQGMGWPDPSSSENLAGFIDLPQGRYLHLSSDKAKICFSSQRPQYPYLIEANAPLKYWQYKGINRVALRFKGHTDIRFSINSYRSCSVYLKNKKCYQIEQEMN